MPNWCYNSVTLSNEDKTKIDALEAALQNEKSEVFQFLRPNPDGEWSYEWSVNNWGCKWDITPHDWDRDGDNTITMNFDSAWSPPIALYEFLESEAGWSIRALYHEPGMCFAGRFEDGYDEYFELDLTDRESVENLPEDILDFTNALEDVDNYEQEQLEEQLAELERTEWYPVKVAPAVDGKYEVTSKAWDFPQYCEYKNGKWARWEGDEIKVVQWRGLVKPYEADEWDPVAELDKIIDETKVD
jgi:hypothetical protein